MSNALELTGSEFDASVAQGIYLVDFWAPWCGPCKMMGPVLDTLANEMEGKAKIAKVNVDNEPGLAQRFSISSIPALIILKDGIEVKRFIGVTGKAELAKALAEV